MATVPDSLIIELKRWPKTRLEEVTIRVIQEHFDPEEFPLPQIKGKGALQWEDLEQQYGVESQPGILFSSVKEQGTLAAIPDFRPTLPLAESALPAQFRDSAARETGQPYDDLLLARLSEWVARLCTAKEDDTEDPNVYVRVDDQVSTIPWEAVFGRLDPADNRYKLPHNLVLYRHSLESSDKHEYRVGHLEETTCALYGGNGFDADHRWLAKWAACESEPLSEPESTYCEPDRGWPHYEGADTEWLPSNCADWRQGIDMHPESCVLLLLAPVLDKDDTRLDQWTLGLEKMKVWSKSKARPVAYGVFPYQAKDDRKPVRIPLNKICTLARENDGPPVGALPYCAPPTSDAAALGHCFTVGVMERVLRAGGPYRLVDICERAREHARDIRASELNLVFLFREDPFKLVGDLSQAWDQTFVGKLLKRQADHSAAD